MTHQTVQALAGYTGMFLFLGLFLVVLVYALRPKNQQMFDHMAKLPLDERE
jgi:cbb3-type cytochrome oxidase subunit 3